MPRYLTSGQIERHQREPASPGAGLAFADPVGAEALLKADRVRLGLPHEPRRTELSGACGRMLDEATAKAATHRRRVDPEILEDVRRPFGQDRGEADRVAGDSATKSSRPGTAPGWKSSVAAQSRMSAGS
jgi:hypothetical protein